MADERRMVNAVVKRHWQSPLFSVLLEGSSVWQWMQSAAVTAALQSDGCGLIKQTVDTSKCHRERSLAIASFWRALLGQLCVVEYRVDVPAKSTPAAHGTSSNRCRNESTESVPFTPADAVVRGHWQSPLLGVFFEGSLCVAMHAVVGGVSSSL